MAKKTKTPTKKEINEVVAEFYDSHADILEFIDDTRNEAVFSKFRKLAANYNKKLEAMLDLMKKRALGTKANVRWGEKCREDRKDGELHVVATTVTDYDLDPLLAEMSEEELLKEQVIQRSVSYTVRPEELDRMVEEKRISEDAYDAAVNVSPGSPSARVPYKPITLPCWMKWL